MSYTSSPRIPCRWLQVLAERYNTFRLEVQTANDKGERATYGELARRITRREDRTAAASMPQPRKRSNADNPSAGAVYAPQHLLL